jgi:D-amino-acid dehydrogenase
MALQADVAVLGAGMVGVSAALHLQERGRSVILIDRNETAGSETSYGNAGLIERSSVLPYMFPRDLGTILRYAMNRSPDMRFHASALPAFAPFLLRYFLASSPAGAAHTAAAALPLIERSLTEHEALMAAADATNLLRRTGWIKAFRSTSKRDVGFAEAERLRSLGLAVETLDPAALAAREPHLQEGLSGAIHLHDTAAVFDPGALAKAYGDLFVRRGGRFIKGDARTLEAARPGWRVTTAEGIASVRDVVVALGPWSDIVFRPLGYALPLQVKRGYHLHFRPRGNAVLNHPVLDVDGGYLLAPMSRGIRLTTGVEFAPRDAPPSPVQMGQVEPVARKLFPLAEQVEASPWMGARPCLPDMLPVIGRAPRHEGLWLDFGHQHHGLTLGPVSGRLLAEMITGETPFTDPAPYRAERF